MSLKEILAESRGGFLAVLVFSFFVNLLVLATPLYMLQVFDRVISSESLDTLLFLTLITGAALLAMAGLEIVRNRTLTKIGVWIDKRLGSEILRNNIMSGRRDAGQSLLDLQAIRSFLTGPAIFPVMDAPWTPLFILVLFALHPTLGWVALTGVFLLFGLAVLNEIATRKPLAEANKSGAISMLHAEEAARNSDAARAMGMVPGLIKRWARQNDLALSLQAKTSLKSGVISALSKSLRLFLQIAAIGVGAMLVLEGQLTAGGMIAASILMARALAPVDQAIGSWKGIVSVKASYKRLVELFSKSEQKSKALVPPSGHLTVENLTFNFAGHNQPVLRNINMQIKPGEVVGLLGPSGAGKTTLSQILVGNLVPASGTARLAGQDIAKWHQDDLGQHIGYLPQDIQLFAGTVAQNIARMGEVDSKLLVHATQLAGVHDEILRLPNGYDTFLGAGGAGLSGGQKQRIALARALYGNVKLVILDEPTSNLDKNGERALLNALAHLKQNGVAVLVISHKQSILQAMDRLMVLDKGLHSVVPNQKVKEASNA